MHELTRSDAAAHEDHAAHARASAPGRDAGQPASAPGRSTPDVQLRRAATADAPAARIHAAASLGTSGAGGPLPYLAQIQRAFGRHDVRGIVAHTDGNAVKGARAMGAEAFAAGHHVAFGRAPSLHTAAHEAAHVVQQRGGVALQGGVGAAGDAYEAHADAVADAVVEGRPAEALLDHFAGGFAGGFAGSPSASTSATGVQRKTELQGIEVEVGLPGYIREGAVLYSPMTLAFGDAPVPGEDGFAKVPGGIGHARCIVHYITNPAQNPNNDWFMVQIPADVVQTMFTHPDKAATTDFDQDGGARLAATGEMPAWQGVVHKRDVTPTPLPIAKREVGYAKYVPIRGKVIPFTPGLADVSQRLFGTCYLQAALIAIISGGRPRDVQALQALLGNESDDEISAFFHNPVLGIRDEVRIKKALPEGVVHNTLGLVSARLTGGAAWCGLLEKAYAAWPGRDLHGNSDGTDKQRTDTNSGYELSYPGAEGGYSNAAFEHLLGRPRAPHGSGTYQQIPKLGSISGPTGSLPWDGQLATTVLLRRGDGRGCDMMPDRFDPGPDEIDPARVPRLPGLILSDADRDLWGAYISQGGRDRAFLTKQLTATAKLGTQGASTTLPVSALRKHLVQAKLSATGAEAIENYCLGHSLIEGDTYAPADVELYLLIRDTLDAGGYVALGTPAWTKEGDRDRDTVPGLPGKHAYGVVRAYGNKGQFYVEIRNPHDSIKGMLGNLLNLDARTNRVMEIREVRRYFTSVYHYASAASDGKDPGASSSTHRGGSAPRYPTFQVTAPTWRDGGFNVLPDAIIGTGVAHGQVIVINEVQYTVYERKDHAREPTAQNVLGKSLYAAPRLRGG